LVVVVVVMIIVTIIVMMMTMVELDETRFVHSLQVRQFFHNLLPWLIARNMQDIHVVNQVTKGFYFASPKGPFDLSIFVDSGE
jgi:hypothetical protein